MHNDMNLIIDNKDIKLSLLTKIFLIIFLILIIFSLFYKVETFDSYPAQVIKKDGEWYVRVFFENNYEKFINDNEILVDSDQYVYVVQSIENAIIQDNNERYMVVNIKTNLDNKYLIDNNYLTIKQKGISDSLFNTILKKIKKGMNL